MTHSSTGADEEEAIAFVDLVAESFRRRRVAFGAAAKADDDDDEGTAARREIDGAKTEVAMQLGLQLATTGIV